MLNLAVLALVLLGVGLFFTPRRRYGAAQRRVIGAQGERDAAILRAEGEAKAIELRGRALKDAPQVVQLTFAEKLAPGVQTIFVPSTGNFLLDLRGMQQTPQGR